jgi:signal transduction histidine kinase
MLDETTEINGDANGQAGQPDKQRRGYRLPLFLLLVIGIVIIGWVTYQSRQEIPRANDDHARHLANTALASKTETISRLAYEASWADRTVRHIEKRLNPSWAQDNIGANLYSSYEVQFSAVYGATGAALIGFNSGRRIFPDPLQKMPPGVRVLVQRARDASMREPKAAFGFLKIGNKIKIAAASAITPRQPTSEQLVRRNRPVLLLWRDLDHATLQKLKKKFDLSHFDFTPAVNSVGQNSVPLISATGQTVGKLYFAAASPSVPVVNKLLLIFGGVLLIIILIFSFLLIRAARSEKRLAQNAEEQTTHIQALQLAAKEETRNESNENLGTALLATVSHELRTPLNLIIGFSDVLMKKADETEPEEMQAQLGFIHAAAEQQLEIVNAILDASKLQAGKMELDIEEFEFGPLIEDIRIIANELMEENDNHLEIEITNNVGTLRTDRLKLRQTLLNLLGNAAKFTDKGLICLSVRRVPDEFGSEVEFTVSDTGIGMTPDEAERVFDAFVQADTNTNRRFRGTGLGLTIAQHFTHLLGGDIALKSESGMGSEFVLTIPAAHFPPISADDEDRVLSQT